MPASSSVAKPRVVVYSARVEPAQWFDGEDVIRHAKNTQHKERRSHEAFQDTVKSVLDEGFGLLTKRLLTPLSIAAVLSGKAFRPLWQSVAANFRGVAEGFMSPLIGPLTRLSGHLMDVGIWVNETVVPALRRGEDEQGNSLYETRDELKKGHQRATEQTDVGDAIGETIKVEIPSAIWDLIVAGAEQIVKGAEALGEYVFHEPKTPWEWLATLGFLTYASVKLKRGAQATYRTAVSRFQRWRGRVSRRLGRDILYTPPTWATRWAYRLDRWFGTSAFKNRLGQYARFRQRKARFKKNLFDHVFSDLPQAARSRANMAAKRVFSRGMKGLSGTMAASAVHWVFDRLMGAKRAAGRFARMLKAAGRAGKDMGRAAGRFGMRMVRVAGWALELMFLPQDIAYLVKGGDWGMTDVPVGSEEVFGAFLEAVARGGTIGAVIGSAVPGAGTVTGGVAGGIIGTLVFLARDFWGYVTNTTGVRFVKTVHKGTGWTIGVHPELVQDKQWEQLRDAKQMAEGVAQGLEDEWRGQQDKVAGLVHEMVPNSEQAQVSMSWPPTVRDTNITEGTVTIDGFGKPLSGAARRQLRRKGNLSTEQIRKINRASVSGETNVVTRSETQQESRQRVRDLLNPAAGVP